MGAMGSVGSKGDVRALFFPPSFGRRCPEGAEVGLGFSLPRSPLSRFTRNGISLDFSVALLLKIKFACHKPFEQLPRWEAKNVLLLKRRETLSLFYT